MDFSKYIRDVEDFPKKGIIFKDITPLLKDRDAFRESVDYFANKYKDVDFICGIESRGFIFGSAIAYAANKGFIPIRKKGKLPYTTVSEKYSLEYGFDEIEIHIDAIENKNLKVLLIDDLIATGGTAEAAVKLLKKLGAEVVAAGFLIELTFLDGAKRIRDLGVEVDSLIKY